MTVTNAQSILKIAFAVLIASGGALVGVGVVIGQVKSNTEATRELATQQRNLDDQARVLQNEVQWQGTILELLARKELGANNLPSRPPVAPIPR